MSAVHGLKILHWVPVMLDEDDGVGRSQVEAESSDVRCKKENIDRGVAVESLNDGVTFRHIGRPIEPHVGHGWHELSEKIVLDNVEHLFELAEDQDSMTRDAVLRGRTLLRARVASYAAVEKNLTVAKREKRV